MDINNVTVTTCSTALDGIIRHDAIGLRHTERPASSATAVPDVSGRIARLIVSTAPTSDSCKVSLLPKRGS